MNCILKTITGLFRQIIFIIIIISIYLFNYSYASSGQKKLVDTIGLPYRYNTGRKRPTKVAPQSGQLKSLKEIKSIKSIKWNKLTGIPDYIRGSLTMPSKDEPASIALNFLEKHKVLWGMENPHLDLLLKRSKRNEAGATTLHFCQVHKGISVLGTFTVSINSEGVITSIINNYAPDIEVESDPEISAEEAKDSVIQHYNKFRNNFDNKECLAKSDEAISWEVEFKTITRYNTN